MHVRAFSHAHTEGVFGFKMILYSGSLPQWLTIYI